MGREDVEIAAEILHVGAYVGRCLGTVDKYWHTVGMGYLDHLLDGIDRTEHIADVCE